VGEEGRGLARISHPMPTYLLGLKKNQSTRSSANARQTKPHRKPTANRWTYVRFHTTGKPGNRMPIVGLTSDSEPTNTHRKLTANRWTYVRLQQRNWKPNANRWTYIGLQPEKEKQLTQTKQKGARRDQFISCLRTSSGMRIRAT
jgi:hypothetical protein